MNWVPVENNVPDFGVRVKVLYDIYGGSTAVYKQIFGSRFGYWHNDDPVIGNLKPTHWVELEPFSNKGNE